MKRLNTILLAFLVLVLALGLGAWTNLYNDTTIVVSISPDTMSVSTVGDSVDTMGYNSVFVLGHIAAEGSIAGETLTAAKYVEFEIEESTGSGVWSDVPDASLTNYVAGNNDGTIGKAALAAHQPGTYYAQYMGSKRWIRIVAATTGDFDADEGVIVTALVIRTDAKYKPVTH